MAEDEFLIPLNMVNKVATASKLKAEGRNFNKNSDRAAIDKITETARTDFVTDAINFILYLLEVLRQTGLSSDNVKGSAAFDPHIMFKRPGEVLTFLVFPQI